MDRGTRIFWTIVAALFCASAFFGVRAESVRRSVQRANATIETGDLATLDTVIDGHTVLLRNGSGEGVTVRLVGIKAFDLSSGGHDATAGLAREAHAALSRELTGKPIRVMLGSPPKDRHGRALATIFVDDGDVAEKLVRDGRVLVYTPYPFPRMADYLSAQKEAANAKRGLWADATARERARLLTEQWRTSGP